MQESPLSYLLTMGNILTLSMIGDNNYLKLSIVTNNSYPIHGLSLFWLFRSIIFMLKISTLNFVCVMIWTQIRIEPVTLQYTRQGITIRINIVTKILFSFDFISKKSWIFYREKYQNTPGSSSIYKYDIYSANGNFFNVIFLNNAINWLFQFNRA